MGDYASLISNQRFRLSTANIVRWQYFNFCNVAFGIVHKCVTIQGAFSTVFSNDPMVDLCYKLLFKLNTFLPFFPDHMTALLSDIKGPLSLSGRSSLIVCRSFMRHHTIISNQIFVCIDVFPQCNNSTNMRHPYIKARLMLWPLNKNSQNFDAALTSNSEVSSTWIVWKTPMLHYYYTRA